MTVLIGDSLWSLGISNFSYASNLGKAKLIVVDMMKEDIKLSDMRRRIEIFRNHYYEADNNILNDSVEYGSLAELREKIKSGCFRIDLNGSRYECMLHMKSDKPQKLYVLFGGARTPMSQFNQTTFVRWSYHSLVETFQGGAVLCVFDPMHYKYPELRLGWYYGTERECYLQTFLEVIKAICSAYRLEKKDVIFFGSSGGGFASLYSAAIYEESMAVVLNPQIYIQNYEYAKYFEKITGIDLKIGDKFERNNLHKLISKSKSKFFIITNICSDDDVNNHLFPLCNEIRIGIDKLSYGINERDNILFWIYEAKGVPNPHNSVETKSIFCAIDYIASRFKSGNITEECSKLALLVNECWRDLYDAKYETMIAKKEIDEKSFVIHTPYPIYALNSNDIVDSLYDIRLELSDKDYSFYRYKNLSGNMFYTLQLDLEVNYPQCTIGLIDKRNKTVHAGVYNTKNRISYSFMVGENPGELSFIVHAGLCGKSKGKSLHIKSLMVMARPLGKLKIAEERKMDYPGDIYWYEECCKSLEDNAWSKGSKIAIYDHHALPWRQMVEIQKILGNHPAAILEMGLGESSKIIAQYATYANAHHVIIDADPQYSKAFLQASPAIFAKTKVHISPLLEVKKEDRNHCCFANFKKIVGNLKFNLIIQHCPRGGAQQYSVCRYSHVAA